MTRLLILLAALFALGACSSARTVSIRTLLDDPGRYDGKTVRVQGDVRESIGALGHGGYRIDDGTGTLNVYSERGGAPREGARVGVEGRFESLFTFGDYSQAVLRERRRFDP